MPYNFAADSFHTKKLCSRLSSSDVRFQTEIGRNCTCWQLSFIAYGLIVTAVLFRTSVLPTDGFSVSAVLSMRMHLTQTVFYGAVATPAQQKNQVILRSEHPRARSPGSTFFLAKVDDQSGGSSSQALMPGTHCQNICDKPLQSNFSNAL